jgi:hypothetical protein
VALKGGYSSVTAVTIPVRWVTGHPLGSRQTGQMGTGTHMDGYGVNQELTVGKYGIERRPCYP